MEQQISAIEQCGESPYNIETEEPNIQRKYSTLMRALIKEGEQKGVTNIKDETHCIITKEEDKTHRDKQTNAEKYTETSINIKCDNTEEYEG